jgi:hypothetical protein
MNANLYLYTYTRDALDGSDSVISGGANDRVSVSIIGSITIHSTSIIIISLFISIVSA